MVDVKSDVTARLEQIPGYEPGKPAHRMDDVTFMDELEAMWGRKWSGQSCIGELRVALLSAPDSGGATEEEIADPVFFTRFGVPGNVAGWEDRMMQHEDRVAMLKSEGVEVVLTDYPVSKNKGPYTSRARGGAGEALIIKGGAIIDRAGVAWKRGPQRQTTEFLARIGCPILYTVHGSGVHEVGGNVLFLDSKHAIQATSLSTNMEGIRQVTPLLEEAGVIEQHISHLPSYLDAMHGRSAAMGFHLVNILNMVDEKLAVCFPGSIPYDTIRYMQSKGIRLIEVPEEEALNQAGNTFAIRPGVIVMAACNPNHSRAQKRRS